MKCCSCSAEIRDDARFCPNCGANQAVAPAPAPEVIPAPVAEPVAEAPAFVPVSEPAPAAAEPAFVPAYEPAPAPVAEPVPAPAPVYEPTPAPVAEPVPAPAPVYEPAPAPVAEPAPQPKYEYVPQSEPIPVAVPVAPAAQPVYQTVYQTTVPVNPNAPRHQLPDGRGLAKMFFLGLITGGIYNMVIMSRIAEEMNMVASKHDGLRTQQYYWAMILTGLTMGIYAFVWIHGLCNRMGDELKRRGINYKFKASTFWLWNILGSLILVGPFIYLHKFCKASNLINRDYNING